MERFLNLMKGILYSWMSPNSVNTAMDLSIAILCGVGLFFLLITFLKDCPLSPASGNKTDIPKDVKRGQSNTRRKTDVEKGCRDGGENVEETKTPSQPMKILTRQLLQDSTPQPFWNSSQKTDHLLLSELFSSLMSLEDLILQKFNRCFWGTSSIFSESVVAMAHVLRNPCFEQQKSVRFSDPCVPAQAPSQAQGLQHYWYQPLPHEHRKTSLVDLTWVPEKEILPRSTPKQIHPSLKRRAYGVSCPTTEKGIQTSLPPECLSHKHGLYSKAVKGYVKRNHQKAIGKPPGNLPRDTLKTKAIRPASEHLRMFQYHKVPQTKEKATNVGEQQGTHIRFPPSKKLKQLQGRFPPNTDHYCKRRPQLSQPGQPSILNSKSYNLGKILASVFAGMTLMKDRADCTMQSQVSQAPQASVRNSKRYKHSKRMGSEPRRVPLKKDTARYDMGKPIKKGRGAGAKNVPHSSWSITGKGLKARNPALRTDELSDINPTDDHSLHDLEAKRKLASNSTKLPVKHRRTPYLQILEALDPTPYRVPASKCSRVVFPSSLIWDSKEEYYSKAAVILENLHHQDPGGTRVESASAASLERALSMHSTAEVQKTQRAPPPAASHRLPKTHPDLLKRNLSIQRSALYFEAKPQEGRIIRGIGKGSLQQNNNPQKAKHAPLKSFHEGDSRHHLWNGTVVGPGERASAAKQTKAGEVKKETPYAWRGSLGSNESHTGKDINISPRVFGSLGAKRSPGHLQTCTPQHSQDSTLRTQGYRNISVSSNKQPQPRPGRHDPECPSTVHPAKVNLSSEHSMSSFQNTCQKPKTAQGSCDVFLRTHERADTEENRVLKDKIRINHLKDLCLHKERQGSIRPTAISQGERLGRSRPCSLSSTQLKDTVKTRTSDKGEATSKSSWKSDIREILKHGYVGSKDIGQGDTSKKDQPPAVAERTEEDWTGKKVICSMIAHLQYLMNFLFEVIEDTEQDTSKVQGCEIESLKFQLGSSSHSSEGVYGINQGTPASTVSRGHTSPEMHNCSFTKRGIGDKTQSGIKAKTACDQHLNQVNRGMFSDQLPMPKKYDLSRMYRGIQHQQELGLTDQTCDQHKITEKLGMTHCPHGGTKGHNHSFGYRKLGDQQQPDFTHKALDPHQSAKEDMGCVSCLSPKGSRPVKHRRTDCFSP
ncbi:spermatogenesis-associated protein 31A6-like [Rattus norvegicus]|uniref:spermatogenesis-associated protein 31A6-like n=1 Tax=Rattus norvegicus TaxID=10116 RepID=UPI0003D0AA06|nr:spermatogenesis-associated protein 31A6-like [Rattus norvegicus]XP_038952251.1 spermatogenesis-associated protein 31A6-like [Rattus norvegicus]XP_038952252.1 spermatogenesis-associated protein 31A6-like [Rattus norvegicus]XP_038952253.1 spermatogenesis-associated protein 31A6-like [Rattus norvegicus]XP_038952254.1 spermatogenesis-associated protein 31A6-like [Rattus norvegicus]